MDPEYVRRAIIDAQRRRKLSLAEAAADFIRGMGLTDTSVIDAVVEEIRTEAAAFQFLDVPGGVRSSEYRANAESANEQLWYTGPEDGDEHWPKLRERLEASGLADVVADIDVASTKVVSHFGDPGIKGLKKKGLVVGYVQSGKTANYTAVIAKAADAGFKLFIVLSGMHNNLRRQTQVRISRDLDTYDWGELTDADSDFGKVVNGAALLTSERPAVAVVKKNAARLQRLRDWLRDIDEGTRARCPILILDDEADQATPNSASAQGAVTRINELLKEIWAEVPTGSYVGYTATPFANVFINPNDDEDLYPSNFIIDLPRPMAYFGAERLFGRSDLPDAEDPDEPLDMVRIVSDDDASSLKPPAGRAAREGFDPELPQSLKDAVDWFILATAIRWARGQETDHSSMLVHTTAFVAPHFVTRDRLVARLADLAKDVSQDRFKHLHKTFMAEEGRAAEVRSADMPSWTAVSGQVPRVLEAVRVVVDNGYSDDRLDYGRTDAEGTPVVETVIAVGGGTLSRGLTLEGLVVSYFLRSSNTYDTLLQMGRWFGYRPGYEDLPRVWMTEDLRDDFQFLALVEEEIRIDMRRLESRGVTPREFGVRVRAHPGRLAITAKAKMRHAELVRVSYAGQRHQTFILHERETAVLEENIAAARDLAAACVERGGPGIQNAERRQFHGVPVADILDFLRSYAFHAGQPGLNSDHIAGWIEQCAAEQTWNVVFTGSSKRARTPDGDVVELGSLDLGSGIVLPKVNRAPLRDVKDAGNIKALLSQPDWVLDADPDLVRESYGSGLKYAEVRDDLGLSDQGLIVVYAVSEHSVPLRAPLPGREQSRRKSEATIAQVALGLVFPEGADSLRSTDADYFAVRPDWTPETDVDADDLPVDREGSHNVDGAEIGGAV
ncbi:Z1 domain-containing protein [Nocardioides baculatus]|uniref:Z1 domain-containing protein n=1 Tax=Nocardioides baculatus TaxID=2801337 RepID=A0ABS1LC32_9ACTN|nr:Z1 domain-containing protein [Nocardioides baculatus]MBL0749253.1 Z1 domain-containing protein [Nocardioides baculatus]